MPEDLLRDAHRRLRVAYTLFALWAALDVLNGSLRGGTSFAIAAGVVALIGSLEYRLRWASRRHPLVGQVWLELSDDGLTFVTPVMSARQTWASFRRYRETPRAFLLSAAASHQIVPKRFFADPAQVDAARRLLAQHLGAR